MADNFLEGRGSWTREDTSRTTEYIYNDEFIDWDYWATLSNITSSQAARLSFCIDPIAWPGNEYAQGALPDDLRIKIERLCQFLECRSITWSLCDLVSVVGETDAPYGMVEAVKKQRIEEAKKNSGPTLPLELLTDEQKQDYNNRAAWSWVDAIYILQGYKPIFQLSTEHVRSHFPSQVHYFTQSIQLGHIGKEIIQAGERTFIDTPANWQAFWQGINKTSEQQAEDIKTYSFEELEKPKDFEEFTTGDLLRLSIPAFFIEAKIRNNDFKQGLYVQFWINRLREVLKQLEEERDISTRLKNIDKVNDKINELTAWSSKDFWGEISELTTEPQADVGLGNHINLKDISAPQQLNGHISILPPPLSLEEKAKLKKLDDKLCIYDIAKLRHPNESDNFIKAYAFEIAKACLLGDLKYHHGFVRHDVQWLCEHPGEASIMDWVPISDNDVIRDIPAPNTCKEKHIHFYANNHQAPEFELLIFDYAMGRRCYITAKDFKEWLITQLDYPIKDDCLIPNWFESVLIADNYLRTNWPKSAPQAEAVGADNVSTPKPKTAKEVFECLKLMVKDPNKLETLLFKNASKTKWLSECKLGDGYNLPMIIKAHSKKGLLKEEYQRKFSEDALEKTLSVYRP